MEIKDLIIIGAGPSGVSAAIYAKRANLDFIIFEKFAIGGQVINAFEIENYPGFNKIFGSDLAIKFMDNLVNLNVNIKYEEVVLLEKNEDIFCIKTSLDNAYYAKNVILALGSNPRKLNILNEDQFTGRGISYCAMCDGNFYKDKEILVYGGGNSAVSEALFLTNIVKKLTIVSRSSLRADKSLVEELSSKHNVSILENKLIDSLVVEDDVIKGVNLKDKFNNELKTINVEGIFVYIGAIPSTGFLNNLDILNKEGYIEVNKHFETKINNLYAIGDVINKDLRQIVTATNDGAFAIHYLLENLKNK